MPTTANTLKGQPKKKANVGGLNITGAPGGQYDPFAAPQFTTGNVQAPAPVTRAGSAYGTNVGGSPLGDLAKNSTAAEVPQSYLDDFAQMWMTQAGGVVHTQNPDGSPHTTSQADFDAAARYNWSVLPNEKKQQYVQKDQQQVAGTNTTNAQGALTQSILAGPGQNAAYANKAWAPVTAATNQATNALGAQVTGNRAGEAALDSAVGQYTGTIQGNQASRMADIGATNQADTGYAQNFMTETLAANGRNTGFANQLTDAANSTNANQSGLFNTFSGQMSGINANQTGLYNNFMGDISSANSQQNQNLSQFGGAVSGANSQSGAILNQFGGAVNQANSAQNQIVQQYSQQLSQMNEQDKAAYLQYIGETNPLMARMIAQASNPQYVANQEDAVQQFKNNYNPQTTDQERFLAELARRKFEGDDKSSRDAVMQQLAGRGLRSGGLTIANQQATQQQLAQDRQMNELGLNANAVQRAERNRVDYSNASNSLRNADDAMRNFQDQYAQNDAVRRGNLAQQRNQQGLNTTGQITARDTSNYNARTQSNQLNYGRSQDYYNASRQTNNDIYGRNLDYYNAGTQTVNDNFGRTQAGYNAGTQTNNDNATRNQMSFNAGTTTNNNNFGRTQTAIGNQIGVNQGNLGNFSAASTRQQTTNDANSVRTQGGLAAGDLGAGSILGAQAGAINFKTGNLQTEQANATNWAPTAANIATQGINTQNSITKQQQDALAQLLGLGTKDQQLAIAKQG